MDDALSRGQALQHQLRAAAHLLHTQPVEELLLLSGKTGAKWNFMGNFRSFNGIKWHIMGIFNGIQWGFFMGFQWDFSWDFNGGYHRSVHLKIPGGARVVKKIATTMLESTGSVQSRAPSLYSTRGNGIFVD